MGQIAAHCNMDLKLPPLGEGADSGTVVNLFVKEGDTITKDQPVLELENEKAVATIPSTAAGTVTQIFVKPGDKIRVGQRILSLGDSGAAAAAPVAGLSRSRGEIARGSSRPLRRNRRLLPWRRNSRNRSPRQRPGTAPAAAPSIRKLARDLGIDLARVPRQRPRRPDHDGGCPRLHPEAATARSRPPGRRTCRGSCPQASARAN